MRNLRLFLRIIIFLLFTFSFELGFCQLKPDQIELSLKHREKINNVNDPEKKLKLYKKYYSKDSACHVRKARKYWKQKSDSIARVTANREKIDSLITEEAEVVVEDVNRQIDKPRELDQITELKRDSTFEDELKKKLRTTVNSADKPEYVDELVTIKPDSTLGDQAKSKIRQEASELEKPELVQEALSVKGLKLDSGFKDSTNVALVKKAAISKAESEIKNQKEFAAIENNNTSADALKEDYFNTSQIPIDSSGRLNKDEAIELAKEQALQLALRNDSFSQLKKLKGQYSKVVNSNDLSTAVKRNSLKGDSFGERLILGGNFNIVETKPFSIDLSGSAGYKLSKKWIAGIQLNHRLGSIDSVSVSGGRLFVNYDIAKNFYAASEFEMMHKTISTSEITSNEWYPGFFLGIGRRMRVLPWLKAQVAVMYNLLHDNQPGIYDKPLVIRFGFNLDK